MDKKLVKISLKIQIWKKKCEWEVLNIYYDKKVYQELLVDVI